MRWIWIDRFELFEPRQRAIAIKNVSLAEDHLHDHFPEFPVMPAALMIEGMAQTAGILVGEVHDFTEKVILAKISRAAFHRLVRPGEQLRYDATLEQISEAAAVTRGVIHSGDAVVGEVDLIFSHIDQNMSGLQFSKENFVFTPQFMALLQAFRGAGREVVPL